MPGRQSSDERLATAKALLALLDPASESYGKETAVDAFLVAGGPSIMKYRLDSMDGVHLRALVSRLGVPEICKSELTEACPCGSGDWMGEARNGATDMIDKIARLPGLQKTCVLFSAASVRVCLPGHPSHVRRHPENRRLRLTSPSFSRD